MRAIVSCFAVAFVVLALSVPATEAAAASELELAQLATQVLNGDLNTITDPVERARMAQVQRMLRVSQVTSTRAAAYAAGATAAKK